MPQVSIIIPAYNVADFIARCVKSCINQSLENIEIIIIDDCSSDETFYIADGFRRRDSRVRIIKNPRNLGTFHARLIGIFAARAEYCMFCDGDDFFAPNACEVALESITRTNCDILQFSMNYFPRTFLRIKPNVHRGFLAREAMLEFLHTRNNVQSLWDKIIKTEILRKGAKILDFIDRPIIMLEDGLMLLAASLHAQSYYGICDELYFYCHNPRSITKDRSVATLEIKQNNIAYLLEVTEALKPQNRDIIKKYQDKLISSMFIETRFHSRAQICRAMAIASKFGRTKNVDFPSYFVATLLSLRYAFRWQNLVRIITFIMTWGGSSYKFAHAFALIFESKSACFESESRFKLESRFNIKSKSRFEMQSARRAA